VPLLSPGAPPCATSAAFLPPNELALSQIVPPPTILRYQKITAVRLRKMQRELAAEPTTDYYDKAMPGQMDPRPKQPQPNKSAGECINESQLRRLKVRGK
jgi:hypothetical protein